MRVGLSFTGFKLNATLTIFLLLFLDTGCLSNSRDLQTAAASPRVAIDLRAPSSLQEVLTLSIP